MFASSFEVSNMIINRNFEVALFTLRAGGISYQASYVEGGNKISVQGGEYNQFLWSSTSINNKVVNVNIYPRS